jgi:septation ring formation regulator EzrA
MDDRVTLDLLAALMRQMIDSLRLVREDLGDLKGRVTGVETSVASLRRDVAMLAEADARASVSMDRIDSRLDRTERRLELAGPHV